MPEIFSTWEMYVWLVRQLCPATVKGVKRDESIGNRRVWVSGFPYLRAL